jgi:nicotinamidase-related amidase
MVKDNLELSPHEAVAQRAKAVVPQINQLTSQARDLGWPVIFATDSFLPGDFMFKGRMKECSIRGTKEAEVTALLHREKSDVWLPKRRMSAFYKTDLDQTLRLWGVQRVAVCGIMTQYCVLTTALDAVCNDFRALIMEDASNAMTDQEHQACLGLYRKSPLDPILAVKTTKELFDKAS